MISSDDSKAINIYNFEFGEGKYGENITNLLLIKSIPTENFIIKSIASLYNDNNILICGTN